MRKIILIIFLLLITSVYADCGNNICDDNENPIKCKDCKVNYYSTIKCLGEDQSKCIYTNLWFIYFFIYSTIITTISILIYNYRTNTKKYWWILPLLVIGFFYIPIQTESVYEFNYNTEETSIPCIDSDVGSVWYQGYCKDNFGTVEDKCQGDYTLEEHSCHNNRCIKQIFHCQCIQGRCVPIPKE